MKSSSDLRERLERILAQNGALVAGAYSHTDSLSSASEYLGIRVRSACEEQYPDACNEAFITPEIKHSPVGFTGLIAPLEVKRPVRSFSAARRLNDALLAAGFTGVSNSCDLDEILNVCVYAIGEVAARNEGLVRRLNLAEATSRREPKVVFRVEECAVQQHDDYERRDDAEMIRLQRVCKSQTQRLENLENRLRLKESEVERLTKVMRAKVKSDDRRSAITMANMREQKLGTAGFVAMNQYQRQIEELEKSNEILTRKCQNLSVRFRHASERNSEQSHSN